VPVVIPPDATIYTSRRTRPTFTVANGGAGYTIGNRAGAYTIERD
jgi:hypothetical protein